MIKSSTLNFVRQKADEAKQLADLHDTLKDIASKDQQIKAQNALLASAKGETTKAVADLKNAQERAAAVQMQSDAVKKYADDMVTAAQGTLHDATTKASGIVAEAKAEASKLMDDARRGVVELRKEMGDLVSEIAHTKSDVASKKSELAELQKQHAELQRRHQALQSGLAALSSNL